MRMNAGSCGLALMAALVASAALAQAPEGSAALFHIHRGDAWYAKNEFDRALAEYDRAVLIAPRLADSYNHRGNARQAKGDLDGAHADYSKALEIDPRFAPAYGNRGNL